jgi:hypothetical protein
MTDAQAEALRNSTKAALNAHGLEVPEGVLSPDDRGNLELRSPYEIARRLMGQHATVAWCCASEEIASSALLTKYIDSNELFELLSDAERNIVNTPRGDAAQMREQVGWFTENIWALAWTLGFETTPGIDGMPIKVEVGPPLTRDFLELFNADVERIVSKVGPRSQEDVIALEDLFYCAHSAARTLARDNEDMRFPCGVVQERRHALTWCLSPGTAWEDIDLSA